MFLSCFPSPSRKSKIDYYCILRRGPLFPFPCPKYFCHNIAKSVIFSLIHFHLSTYESIPFLVQTQTDNLGTFQRDMFKRLKIAAESFLSKSGEKLADYVVDTGLSLIELDRKLQKLKTNSRKLSCIASDLETELKSKEASGRRKRKREVETWLEMVREIETEFDALETQRREKRFISRLLSGDRVANLNSRMEALVEQSHNFNGIVLDAPDNTRELPLVVTSKLSGQTFTANLGRVKECLLGEKVPIIGIYGPSGVGKTALAMHIHDLVLEETENRVYWIKLSEESATIKKLQDDVAKVIGLTFTHDVDEGEKRRAELNRALRQRAGFVLILDGVGKSIDLERLGYPVGVDDCQLIITSSCLEVCRRIGCKRSFEVERIDRDEAWELFKEKFRQGDEEIELAQQVEEIAKSIVEKCGCLPGRIIKMAREMRGATGLSEWRAAFEEMGEFLQGDD